MAIYSGVWGPAVGVAGTAPGLSGTFGLIYFLEGSISE